MIEKKTGELEKILEKTHAADANAFIKENRKSMLSEERAFAKYMKEILQNKKILQNELFLKADIPERYGYKLLSEEKRTRQRDVILRICFSAQMTLEETQKALKIYKMPELYVKYPRDALLMICFNEKKNSISDINALLKENGMEELRESGLQE